MDLDSDRYRNLGRLLRSVPRVLLNQWILLVLALFVMGFSIASPRFLSLANLRNIASFLTEPLLLAVGQTFVIISGGIDLSVGAILALAGIVGSMTMKIVMATTGLQGLSIALGMAAGLLVGLACGAANGMLIAKLRVPPFVVTLGMLGIARGFAYLLTSGTSVTGLPRALGPLGNQVYFGYVPLPFLVAVVLTLAAAFVLRSTRLGRHTYAIGGNPRAALRAGIPTQATLVSVYSVSGVFAGAAGVLLLARFATGSPIAGQQSELDAIAAAVIGGASLFGGIGTIFGSVVGASLVSVLLVGLVISNVPPYWQLVATGAILIIAVFIDQVRHRRR